MDVLDELDRESSESDISLESVNEVIEAIFEDIMEQFDSDPPQP